MIMIKLYGGTWSRKVCQNEESRLTGSYKNNIAKFHCMLEFYQLFLTESLTFRKSWLKWEGPADEVALNLGHIILFLHNL